VAAGATVTISDLTFSEVVSGSSHNTNAIANQGNLTLRGVVANGASSNLADIDNDGGTLDVDDSTIQGANIANEGNGSATILNSTVRDSSDWGIRNDGGDVMLQNDIVSNNADDGIINDNQGSTLTVLASTIADNAAEGIYTNGISATIVNSTISGNSDGIYAMQAPALITNSTISGNHGYGIASPGGGVTLSNSIVAGNLQDVSWQFTSLGHNLIGVGDSGSGYVSSDLVGTTAKPLDAKLGSLQNNGGPTPTMALLTGSPALDAGSDANAPPTDQRGVPRPQGTHVDIGAYELEVPIALTPGSSDNSFTGKEGIAFSQIISASGGDGVKTLTYRITSGTLPAGLHLVSSANQLTLAGTPTAGGTVRFEVTATDASGDTATQSYTLTIAPAPIPPAPSQTVIPAQVQQGLRDTLSLAEGILSGNAVAIAHALQDYQSLLPAAQQEVIQTLTSDLFQLLMSGHGQDNRALVDTLFVVDGFLSNNLFFVAFGLHDYQSAGSAG